MEQLENVSVALKALDLRSQEVSKVLTDLDERFQEAASRVSRMLGRVRREVEADNLDNGKSGPANLPLLKIEYTKLSEKDQNNFHLMIALGSALYRVAQMEILDKQGRVTKNSETVVGEVNQLLKQI